MCTPTALSRTVKGVTPGPPHVSPEMWTRWPGRWSPHVPLAVPSMALALVHKALVARRTAIRRKRDVRAGMH